MLHREDTYMTEIPIEAQIKPFIFLILLICFLSLNIIYAKTNENLGNKREINAGSFFSGVREGCS